MLRCAAWQGVLESLGMQPGMQSEEEGMEAVRQLQARFEKLLKGRLTFADTALPEQEAQASEAEAEERTQRTGRSRSRCRGRAHGVHPHAE